MDIDETVGLHLKTVREENGLSQRKLARETGVSNGTISLIEQGRLNPSVSLLKRVLDGIPISLSEFLQWRSRQSPKSSSRKATWWSFRRARSHIARSAEA